MPPNRKTNAEVVDSFATLSVQGLVNPKFLPLTHPDAKKSQEEAPKQQRQVQSQDSSVVYAPHALDAAHPAQSYWDWPSTEEESKLNKEQILKTIAQEEAIRQTFSVNHIEATLQNAAVTTPSDSSNVVHVKSTSEQEENYWFMPNETSQGMEEEPAPKANCAHDSYWKWSTPTEEEERSQLIDQIKQEEECRVMFSIDHIQQSLIQQCANPSGETKDNPEHDSYWDWTPETKYASHVSDPQHSNNSYWDWPSAGSVEEKSEMIQEIVREEAIRQGMSVDHVESQLVREAAATSATPKIVMATTGTNSSYWDW